MKLLLIINKDEQENLNSAFSLGMTASATGDEVTILGMCSGAKAFVKENAAAIECCGMKIEDLAMEGASISVCICKDMCASTIENLMDNVDVVDTLGVLHMIKEADRVVTF